MSLTLASTRPADGTSESAAVEHARTAAVQKASLDRTGAGLDGPLPCSTTQPIEQKSHLKSASNGLHPAASTNELGVCHGAGTVRDRGGSGGAAGLPGTGNPSKRRRVDTAEAEEGNRGESSGNHRVGTQEGLGEGQGSPSSKVLPKGVIEKCLMLEQEGAEQEQMLLRQKGTGLEAEHVRIKREAAGGETEHVRLEQAAAGEGEAAHVRLAQEAAGEGEAEHVRLGQQADPPEGGAAEHVRLEEPAAGGEMGEEARRLAPAGEQRGGDGRGSELLAVVKVACKGLVFLRLQGAGLRADPAEALRRLHGDLQSEARQRFKCASRGARLSCACHVFRALVVSCRALCRALVVSLSCARRVLPCACRVFVVHLLCPVFLTTILIGIRHRSHRRWVLDLETHLIAAF